MKNLVIFPRGQLGPKDKECMGAHLYEKTGYPEEYIQLLLGHADAKMTQHYLSGYGEKWEEVAADLPLTYR